MESPAKERLTGALILIAALVIIVPEMFSGPAPERRDDVLPAAPGAEGPPLRTYDMPLDATGGDAEVRQDALTPQAAGAPVVQRESVPPPAPAPRAEPQPPVPVSVPAKATDAQPVARSSAPPPADDGDWWVQLGSFSSRENVDRLVRQLRADGIAVDVSQIRAGSKELQRVRAGPVRDRAAAVALQSRLAAAGHRNTTLVTP